MRSAAAFVAAAIVAIVIVACTRTVVLAPPGPPDSGSVFPDGFMLEDAGGSGGGSGFPADAGSDGGIAPDGP